MPLYYQVACRIREAVDNERLAHGSMIGPESALAVDFRVSLPTLRKAMDILTSEGITVRRPGRGTFIAGRIRYQPLRVTLASGNGNMAKTRVLTIAQMPVDPNIQRHLHTVDGGVVWSVIRQHNIEGRPTAILKDFLVAMPDAGSTQWIAEAELNDALLSGQTTVGITKSQIRGMLADDSLSDELRVPRGTPLVVLERTAFSDDGSPIEFGCHVFLASHYLFECST